MITSSHFTFSDERMLRWLDRLDSFEFKYDLKEPNTIMGDCYAKKRSDLLWLINRYEETFAPTGYRDDDAAQNHEMLKLIYQEIRIKKKGVFPLCWN